MTKKELEKEAEEAIKKKYHTCVSGYKSLIRNWQEGAEVGYNKCKEELEGKLTKAKEIIQAMLRDIPNRMWYTDATIKEAEQFLKEDK